MFVASAIAETIVGVNKHRLAHEERVEVLAIDNTVVREKQIARLQQVRASRDDAKCRQALEAITQACNGGGNLLALSIEAARSRATVGEITDAMETVMTSLRTTASSLDVIA